MSAYAEILARLGEAQARAAAGKAQLWGQAIQNIGQIPAQIQQAKREDALTLLDQARELRARGEYDLAQKKFAEAERTHQNQKAITAAMFTDPQNPDVTAGVQKAIELGEDPAFAYELGQKIGPQFENAPAGSAARNRRTGEIVPGSQVPKEAEPGTIGEYLMVKAKEKGGPLTSDDIANATRDYEAAKRPPIPPSPSQTHTMRLPGVGDVPVDYVPNKDGTGGKWMYQGQDVTGTVRAIPPASIVLANQPMPTLPAWTTDASRPTGPEGNQVDPTLGLTPNGLYQAAITYIQTGQFPPTSRSNAPRAVMLRNAVENKAGAMAADAGMDVPTFRAFYKANAGSLTQQQKFYDSAQAFLATADKNAELLDKTLAKLPDTGSPLLNRPFREFSKTVMGDPTLSQFSTYLASVQNEYAKILNNPNLSGQLTDSARAETQKLVDGNATVNQILASLQALRAEGGNRLVSIGDQIQRIRGRMQTPGDGQTSAAPPARKLGDIVTRKDGSRYRIVKLNPDGTYDVVLVK